MSNTANNPTKVITGPNTRWSYCNAWEAKAIQGGTPKFSVSLIIPKSDKKTIAKIEEAIKAAYREGEAKLKGNGRSVPALSVLKTPLRDGDVERPDDEAYADSYFVNANSTTAPGIVDADRQPILDHALQVGTDSEGGYLVPDEYERTLVEALEEENIFRQMAKVIKTSSGDRKIPVVASKGTASWIDEEGAYPESDDSFGQVSIGAYKLGTMIKVSEELLNDSVFDLQSYISREFARRIGAKEEEAFFTGDGKGKPLGVLAATGGAETGVTAASATAVTADELMDLYYSLKSPYRKKSVWVLNDSTIKAIRKLKDNNGQYLWQPSLTAGAPDMILGRPIKTSAYMPAIAAGAKTIAFGDFSYYWIADRQGRSFKRLNELFAATGQVGFLASQRVDGKMILAEAVKVLVQKAASAG